MFGKKNHWDVEKNVPDLAGQVIIVTGGNIGLGFENCRQLVLNHADVVMAVRSKEKGDQAREKIASEIPAAKIHVMVLDLASFESIKAFADEFLKHFSKLNVLVNNAGVMMCPLSRTRDGVELQIGVNHLGHFYLTSLLLGILRSTPKSRIVNVSSNAHKKGNLDFDDLSWENRKYSKIQAYCDSKLANLLFTLEFNKKQQNESGGVIAVAAHPGFSSTGLGRHVWGGSVGMWFGQSAFMGSLPTLRAIVDPEVKADDYFGPNGFMELTGHPVLVKPKNKHFSDENARKLWEWSETMISNHK